MGGELAAATAVMAVVGDYGFGGEVAGNDGEIAEDRVMDTGDVGEEADVAHAKLVLALKAQRVDVQFATAEMVYQAWLKAFTAEQTLKAARRAQRKVEQRGIGGGPGVVVVAERGPRWGQLNGGAGLGEAVREELPGEGNVQALEVGEGHVGVADAEDAQRKRQRHGMGRAKKKGKDRRKKRRAAGSWG